MRPADVIKGIRKSIEEFQSIKKTVIVDDELDGAKPSISTLEWLDDTEITLTHRNVDKIKLSDIYVIPDVELRTERKMIQEYLEMLQELSTKMAMS